MNTGNSNYGLKKPRWQHRWLNLTSAEFRYMSFLLESKDIKAYLMFIQMKKHEQWGEKLEWLEEDNNKKENQFLKGVKPFWNVTKQVVIIFLVWQGVKLVVN